MNVQVGGGPAATTFRNLDNFVKASRNNTSCVDFNTEIPDTCM